ncbi:MAG TPA: hypothetical protein VE132_08670 [Micromonosporaceae bacterium]|nr:hypothetical protein [Micromonosporaceae bacterium]
MRRRGTTRGFSPYFPGYDEATESDTLQLARQLPPALPQFPPQEDLLPGGFETFLPPPAAQMPSRVSIWAAGGALIAVVAICATVTGLLAPVGAAIGVVATLASLIGLRTTGRHLAGHGLAIVGVLLGLAAIVIGAFAVTRHYAWPNSTVDEIARWHSWLVARWPWLSH